jgi:hypothetical protein
VSFFKLDFEFSLEFNFDWLFDLAFWLDGSMDMFWILDCGLEFTRDLLGDGCSEGIWDFMTCIIADFVGVRLWL